MERRRHTVTDALGHPLASGGFGGGLVGGDLARPVRGQVLEDQIEFGPGLGAVDGLSPLVELGQVETPFVEGSLEAGNGLVSLGVRDPKPSSVFTHEISMSFMQSVL